MQDAQLQNAQLAAADLTEVNARHANFSRAGLEAAQLREGRFEGASFARARLSGARFYEGDFNGADFSGADLSGAQFHETDLSHARGLKQAQLEGVCLDSEKRACPPGLKADGCGRQVQGHDGGGP